MSSTILPASESPIVPAPVNPLLPFVRVSLSRKVIAFFILLLVTLVRFLPSLPQPTVEYLGGIQGDNGLYVWLFRYHVHNIFSSGWFETNGFYPYQGTLAWSDNFLLPGFLGWLLVSCGLSEAASFNLIIFLAYAFSGYFLWLCITRITGSTTAGLISSVAWLSWSYWGLHLGRPQLLFHLFLPAGVYLFFCALRAPSLLIGAFATLLMVCAFATTAYYAIFLVLIWSCLLFALTIAKPEAILRRANARTLVGMLCLSPLLLPFVAPYLNTLALFGERGLYEAHYFSANARAWLAAPSSSLIYSATNIWGAGEAFLFPGILTGLLAVLSLLRLARSRGLKICLALVVFLGLTTAALSVQTAVAVLPYPWRVAAASSCWLLLLAIILFGLVLRALEARRKFSNVTHRAILFAFFFLTIVFAIFALGPLGNPEKNQLTLGPWAFAHILIPGVSAVRAVSRCAIISMLGLCAMAGLGFGLKLPSWPKLLIAAPFIILIIWVEGSMTLQPAQSLPQSPQALSALPRSRERPVIIALPFTGQLDEKGAPASWADFASKQTLFLNALIGTKAVAINGYSGQQTKLMRELPRALLSFPDERSIAALCSFAELRFIFIVADFALPSQLPASLIVLSVDTDRNRLLGLNCGAVPFASREFILPANTQSISCETSTPDLFSISAADANAWKLTSERDRIKIERVVYDHLSNHLARVTIETSGAPNSAGGMVANCVLGK